MPDPREKDPFDVSRVKEEGPRNVDDPDEREIAADYVVDENGAPIEVPPDKEVVSAEDYEPTVGATGPTNWWRMGLIALGALIVLLLILQVMTGGEVAPVQVPDGAPAPSGDTPATTPSQ